jgi:hypothetical protein
MRADRWYKEDITYWAPLPGDSGYGSQNLAEPVTFRGRWEDKEQAILSSKGEEVVSKAQIYYPPYLEIVPDGWVARGRYDDLLAPTPPASIAGAFIVRQTTEIPDMRNLNVVKVAIV